MKEFFEYKPYKALVSSLKKTCFFLNLYFFIFLSQVNAQQPLTVVLDAGHGGKDPGKISRGYKEKDLALKITLLTGKLLEKNKNIKVIYTRKKDVFINLYERGKIANKANADLFVSIHCNAHKSNAFGTETFVLGLHANNQNFEVAKAENEVIYLEDNYENNYDGYDINSPESVIGITIMQEVFLEQSVQLASIIQNHFSRKLKKKNRGVKQAGFIVLHQTFMPSVLVEVGFITNKKERNYLRSKRGQTDLAKSISSAILKYRNVAINKKSFINVNEQSNSSNLIKFKVQLLVSSKKISNKDRRLKGLKGVTSEKVKRLYKYYYGNTTNYKTALNLKKQAISKGFKDSFLIAIKGKKKISISKALALLSKK